MASSFEVRTIIAGLPNEVGKRLFEVFSVELMRLEDFSGRSDEFRTHIDEENPQAGNLSAAIQRWRESKASGVLKGIVDCLYEAIRNYYGEALVSKEDLCDFVKSFAKEVGG